MFQPGQNNTGFSTDVADIPPTKRPDDASSPYKDTQLPEVRLTPPVKTVFGEEGHRQSLNGTWQYTPRVPEGFDGTAASLGETMDAQVPGQTWLQELPLMEVKELHVPCAFTRTFEVSPEWDGRYFALQFESLDGYSKIYVNGQKVGEVDGGYIPSEFDVTDAIKPGETNELVVTIELSLLSSWIRREMGNVARPVWLQSLPTVHVSRFHVDTTRTEDGRWQLEVIRKVENHTDQAVEGVELRLDIPGVVLDAGSTLTAIPARESNSGSSKTTFALDKPIKPWHPESPNLYDATLTLMLDDEPLMTVGRRVGFRTVTAEDGVLKINGIPFTVKGTNYHTTYPGSGHHPTPEQYRADIENLVALNHNSLRVWQTPSSAYMDACDELGMTTTMEVPMNEMIYGRGFGEGQKGNDPAMTEPFLEFAGRVFETYRSYPSNILWGLANEAPYYDYFEMGAFGFRNADPNRPVFFGSDMRIGISIPGTNVNDDHYPLRGRLALDDPAGIVGGAWEFPTDEPNIFTEWAHVPWNNTTERAWDPAIHEFFSRIMLGHMKQTWLHPHVAGGYVFSSTPLRGLGRHYDFGYYDVFRRPNASAWAVYQAYSPVWIEAVEQEVMSGPTDYQQEYRHTIRIKNRFDSQDLNGVRVYPIVENPHRPVESVGSLPQANVGDTIEFVYDHHGSTGLAFVDERDVVVQRLYFERRPEDGVPTAAPVAQDANGLELNAAGGTHTIVGDGFTFTLSADGALTATVDDTPVLTGTPTLAVRRSGLERWPANKRPIENMVHEWITDNVTVEQDGDNIVATIIGAYSRAKGSFTYTIAPTGEFTVAYDLTWTHFEKVDAFNVGVMMPVPDDFDRIDWRTDGFWHTYGPDEIGRPVGTATRLGPDDTLAARRAWEPATPYRDGKLGKPDVPKTWPWNHDLLTVDGMESTKDFRATRFDFRQFTISDGTVGLRALADGDKHAQAIADRDRRMLQISYHHNGGTEFHLVKSLRADVLITQPGTKLADEVTFQLVRAAD